jgi:hypothetical protein
MRRLLAAALVLLASPGTAGQDPEPDVEVPAAARPFVTKGTRALAFESADLNRDGRPDAILVVEAAQDDPESDGRPRTLLVLAGQPDGTFREAARNAKIVYCSRCGGMMGDPFQGVTAGPGRFTVQNAGGSGWRWGVSYRFDYSRRDDAWQLVRVEEDDFHASDAATPKRVVSTPPKHFGKIEIKDFDPENWKGQGPK